MSVRLPPSPCSRARRRRRAGHVMTALLWAACVIPVALLGSEYHEITDIDVSSLRFGPSEALPKHNLIDKWTYNEHVQDVNLDGSMNLMLHFKIQDTGIDCGNTDAALTGTLLDGERFQGTDTFETVGCSSNRPRRGVTSRENRRRIRR